jgi:hypothetical protein
VLIAALAKEASKGIESPGQAEKCHGQQQLPGGLRTVNFFCRDEWSGVNLFPARWLMMTFDLGEKNIDATIESHLMKLTLLVYLECLWPNRPNHP